MDDDKDQLISADGDSDGAGEDKVIDPDLLDEVGVDDAALEDDLEEEDFLEDEDDDEDDESYNLDTDDQ